MPYPDGFELDHVVALMHGGEDSEDNVRVLCHDCHAGKTAKDMGHRQRVRIGLDGYPVE